MHICFIYILPDISVCFENQFLQSLIGAVRDKIYYEGNKANTFIYYTEEITMIRISDCIIYLDQLSLARDSRARCLTDTQINTSSRFRIYLRTHKYTHAQGEPGMYINSK